MILPSSRSAIPSRKGINDLLPALVLDFEQVPGTVILDRRTLPIGFPIESMAISPIEIGVVIFAIF